MIHRFLCLPFAALALLLLPAAALAQEHEEEELDPVHHVADGYYLDFSPFGKAELPRLFVVRRADGRLGFDVFGSTHAALESGRYVAEGGDPGGHGSYLDAVIVPAEGELVVDLSITRHLVFAWIGALIVLLIFVSLARRYQRGIGRETAPRGIFQNLFETLIVFVRDEIARPNLGEKAGRYLPYLLSVFFFILTCNLLGLVPFGATATSNLMITAVLAAFTFLLTQFGGSKDYWLHIFWPPGVPTFVKPILIPVEILGIFTKPFALAIRLFANMTAGHLVILSLIGLIFTFRGLFGTGAGVGVAPVSVAFSLFIYLLELLVAFIQAYIFTMLSALFIGMAVEEHHHHEAHAEHGLRALSEVDHPTPLLAGSDGEPAIPAGRQVAPVPASQHA
ncbi:F0F1 ATP synthase subunit A [Rhodocaloribacter litoris]|uniref:F0F1 ATP synthase subunit A n=1 Tax=Rhodocaloribacter litoris TaxID=2558931 RepID=UPI001422BA4F|nr:F0F1 ATP synthase subunit A [Rhodocaloribacter litoris]QXD13990.1 F0F1 ATP synthase subunit A [Rhodocaloribacter litoris]